MMGIVFQRFEQKNINTRRPIPGRWKEQHTLTLRAQLSRIVCLQIFLCTIMCSCTSFHVHNTPFILSNAEEIISVSHYNCQDLHLQLMSTLRAQGSLPSTQNVAVHCVYFLPFLGSVLDASLWFSLVSFFYKREWDWEEFFLAKETFEYPLPPSVVR